MLLFKHLEHLLLLLLVELPDLGDEGAEGDDDHVDGDERHVDEGKAQSEILLLEALLDKSCSVSVHQLPVHCSLFCFGSSGGPFGREAVSEGYDVCLRLHDFVQNRHHARLLGCTTIS